MFRRAIDSFLGTVLLAALLPIVFLSAMHARFGPARPPKRSRREQAHPVEAPAAQSSGEFHFDRAVEAYEKLIDTVIAEKRA